MDAFVSPEDLRQSASMGAGPTFRGKSLVPTAARLALIERTSNAVNIADCALSTEDAIEIAFIASVDLQLVRAASYDISEGRIRHNPDTWSAVVFDWAENLQPPIQPAEIAQIKEEAWIIQAQIEAAQFRSVKGISVESSERDSGN